MTIEIKIEDGHSVIFVPLVNSDRKAAMWEEDYTSLMKLGVHPQWKLYMNHVTAPGKKRIQIARVIRNAGAKEKVVYLDKDTTNLRGSNLALAPGAGKFKAREQIQ